jgi:hypothetical protein
MVGGMVEGKDVENKTEKQKLFASLIKSDSLL